ncbi:MAG: hypothetical protein HOQ06_03150 [Pseudarthrobacter sp.]|nr:hypothetical protein [Pseudarthrobacter sp.]
MVSRCAMLLVALAALLRFETAHAGRRSWLVAAVPRHCRGTVPGGRLSDGDRAARDHHERGDVPGWVMITLMSAVLVAALLALAGPALEAMFNQAMDKVGG